jgi:nucleotide-binding universal stress UspA family protein
MFKRLVALYDFSWTGRQALRWALGAGEAFHSRLKVLHVSPGGRNEPSPEDLTRSIREEIDRDLRKGSEPTHALEDLEVEVKTGHAVFAIADALAADRPDLVVLGTHGRTGLLHVLLGSVAEKIVRHSPCPALVVRGASPWPPKCVLAAVDFDESAGELLLAAAEWRRATNGRVEAVHVVVPPAPVAYLPEAAIALPAFDPDVASKEAEGRLRALFAGHPSLPAVLHTSVGQPAAKICEKAREIGADLILVASHGRAALTRFLIGSVAEQVVRYAPCHVLSFRSGKFST